ncbi:hydrogenase subunit, partial [mine drainage metagenome]
GDYLLLRAELDSANPALPSLTPHFAGAARGERGWHDLLGVVFVGHPARGRWLRHQAWGEDDYPLAAPTPAPAHTPADTTYPFARVAGGAVHEVAVGPIHAGIIEPGHFRFASVGERALQLELRLGYVHRGVQRIACGRDAAGLLRLAARVSGDSAVAHAWAAAMALEHAAGITPPARALALRACWPSVSAWPIISAMPPASPTTSVSVSRTCNSARCASAGSGAARRCSGIACCSMY